MDRKDETMNLDDIRAMLNDVPDTDEFDLDAIIAEVEGLAPATPKAQPRPSAAPVPEVRQPEPAAAAQPAAPRTRPVRAAAPTETQPRDSDDSTGEEEEDPRAARIATREARAEAKRQREEKRTAARAARRAAKAAVQEEEELYEGS